MSALLFGDSHLAWIQGPRLELLEHLAGCPITNAAVSGSVCTDLAERFATRYDVVVMSVGTNDAAQAVPLDVFERVLTGVLARVSASIIGVTSPGIDESRLGRWPVFAEYADALARLCRDAGGTVIDVPELIAPLGPDAFVEDGVHLSDAAYDLLVPAIAAEVRAQRPTDRLV